MPRKKKTLSGDATQAVQSVPGQRYGEGVAQEAMQQAMPAPLRTGEAPAVTPRPSAVPLRTNRGEVQQPAPLESGVAELLNNVPKNVLRQPGSSANVPTAGISVGPGRGPNVGYMGTNMSPYKRTLMTLAMNTNNPVIRQLWESL